MARLLGHRQTKGTDRTSQTYCYRATSLLYRLPTINIVWFCIAYHKWIVQYSSSTSIPESGFLRFRSKSLLCSPTNRRRIVNSVILSLAIARLGSEPAATPFALPSSFLNDLIG